MSAIFGCVSLDDNPVEEELAQVMREPFNSYGIDRFSCRTYENVMMGCGIQYIQPEAKSEELPFVDEAADVVFTADCYIDNRSELIAELCPDDALTPDGTLLYKAYRRWGEGTSKRVYGSYAFAVYEKKTNTLLLSADHTFSRSIYFARDGNRVYFSTLIKPILSAKSRAISKKLNERWICGYLGQAHLGVLTEPFETAFEGVYKVKPHHYMLFGARASKSVQFWFPERVPKLERMSDEEYQARFLSVMETAAAEATRTDGEVGILLSSGMDSSTVAAFAASELSNRDKKLFSYTSVPLTGYQSELSWTSIVDETEGVTALCGMYPNIEAVFDSLPNLDAMNGVTDFINMFEQPYKALANTPWMNGFTERAANENVRILLTGQSGNVTLSSGGAATYLKTNFLRGKWIRIIKFFRRFGSRTGVKWKRALLYYLPVLIPGKLRRLFIRDYLKVSFLRYDAAAASGFYPKSEILESNVPVRFAHTFEESRGFVAKPSYMSQIGEAETKIGLKHGVIYRDITKDVRLLEFCLGAPMECFVGDDGMTRRLIRKYMRGRLPSSMLCDEFRRGVQAADKYVRLARCWERVYSDLAARVMSPEVLCYADERKVSAALSLFADAPPRRYNAAFMNLEFVYALSLFLGRV